MPEEDNVPVETEASAENEVPVNDEVDHVATEEPEEEIERTLPPRWCREEGQHGMGPPPTRWDEVPRKGCKGGQVPLHGQRPPQGAQPWFQQHGGKGAGFVQQPYMQQGPPGLRGQQAQRDARILQAQAQQWEAICKLNAAMGMLPPRPVPVQLLRPPTPGVGIPGVDYSLALRPLPPLPPPPEEGSHGGVTTASKAAGTTHGQHGRALRQLGPKQPQVWGTLQFRRQDQWLQRRDSR
eukprot:s2011_g3.t1